MMRYVFIRSFALRFRLAVACSVLKVLRIESKCLLPGPVEVSKGLKNGVIKKSPAFTILELLISISLSTFVILGLMQAYRNTMNFVDQSREMIQTNRKVCLVFNQLERDFNAAFIPMVHKEIVPATERKSGEQEKQEDVKKPKTPEDAKKAREKEKDKRKDFFFAIAGDGDAIKVEGKRIDPFKSVTFISTNPLQVFGSKRTRFVRVMYELVLDKAKSKKDKENYRLVRKESHDIENVKMKISEFDHQKAKTNPIRTHVVAENIKGMYFEYVTIKDEKDKKKKESKASEEPQELRSSTWGDKDYSKGFVPRHIEVTIVFWNSDASAHHSFSMSFPILSYPTLEEEISEKKKKIEVLKNEIEAQLVPQQGKPRGQQAAVIAQDMPEAE